MPHHFLDEEPGKSCERHTVNGDADTLLNCSDGAFDFADMSVGGCGIKGNGREFVVETFEFHAQGDVSVVL